MTTFSMTSKRCVMRPSVARASDALYLSQMFLLISDTYQGSYYTLNIIYIHRILTSHSPSVIMLRVDTSVQLYSYT